MQKTIFYFIYLLTISCTCIGQTIYFGNKTNEQIIASLEQQHKLSDLIGSDKIIFFNNDTIVVSGYHQDYTKGQYNLISDIIYRTFNGGKTWEMIHFSGDAWIYCAHSDSSGKIWMGGSDEYIHYSTDFGTSWTKKKKPFLPIDRVLSIYMIDSINGIAGGLSNGLAITKDNWETTTQVTTPWSQKKFRTNDIESRTNVEKVQILDSLIIINQNEHIYYSKTDKINWKEFNIPIKDFAIDKAMHTIKLYSLRGKVYILSSNIELIKEEFEVKEEFSKDTTSINLNSFFNSEIVSMQLNEIFLSSHKGGGCIPYTYYEEHPKTTSLTVLDKVSIDNIQKLILNNNNLAYPSVSTIQFKEIDLKDYQKHLTTIKKERKEEKKWGGDFSYLVNTEHPYFKNYNATINNLTQKIITNTFVNNTYSIHEDSAPYFSLYLINTNADTLKITNKNALFMGLPWTVEYKENQLNLYDPTITSFFQTKISSNKKYYKNLLGGELIYLLIEERIIEEQVYKKE